MAHPGRPWESLRFLKEIRIIPESGIEKLDALVEFKYDYDSGWCDSYINSKVFESQNSRTINIRLGHDSVIEYRTDYPLEFKKLVHATGSWEQAWEVWVTTENGTTLGKRDWDLKANENAST